MQIEFSEIAKQTLRDQIIFLETIWSNREIVILLQDIRKVSNNLKKWSIQFVSKIFKRYPFSINRQKARKNVFPSRKRYANQSPSLLRYAAGSA
jgi:hypothetical protein